jgi:hypothetical protein
MPTQQQERIAHARRVYEGGDAQQRKDAAIWLASQGVITSLGRPQLRRNVAANEAREHRQQVEQAAIDQQFGLTKTKPKSTTTNTRKGPTPAALAAIARGKKKLTSSSTRITRNADGSIRRG